MIDAAAAIDRVLAYHEATKHQPERFARSLGYLDWATKPDPFRRYQAAPTLHLALCPAEGGPSFDDLYTPRRTTARPVEHGSISQLLYDSLALSAWKQLGRERWSLRCNPSSGNLHPTEAYLISDGTGGMGGQPAVLHYRPFDHSLERRRVLAPGELDALRGALPAHTLFVGLSSIHWREAWKYGERAYRYCQHDVGHAVAAVALAASALGWSARLLEGIGDDELAVLLGIHEQSGIEAEHPDALIALLPSDLGAPDAAGLGDDPSAATRGWTFPVELAAALRGQTPTGQPNPLSSSHHDWPTLAEVAAACRRPGTDGVRRDAGAGPPASAPLDAGWQDIELPRREALSGRRILRQRRSAVAMDGATRLERDDFFRILVRALPTADGAPLSALPWAPAVHLLLFVHRVDGLAPGLYVLVRHPASEALLRAELDAEFEWERPPGCPAELPLYRLDVGDVRLAAARLSCGQDIASDGVFAVAMLAELEERLQEHGASFYRRLYWEAGAIGQILYLEAEAARLRGTGIGCFFDDAVHQVLGVEGRRTQILYHFTVGAPVVDHRLQTLPAYAHLDAEPGPPGAAGASW